MKKIAKLFAVLSAIALLGTVVSCSNDDGSDPLETSPNNPNPRPDNPEDASAIWEGAEMIEALANTEYTWQECNISSEWASRLQVGSKVIFEIEKKADAAGAEYAKFRVTKGWTACGVSKYYTADGNEVLVKEDTTNLGTYENEAGNGGTYYFAVEESNIANLKTGFDLCGNFKLVKIGITNLKEKEAEDPNVQKTITLEKNQYVANPESQAKVALDFNEVKVGDKVTVKLVGKATRAFKGEFFIVDTTSEAGKPENVGGYWGELAEKYPADEDVDGVKTNKPLDVPAEFTIEHVFEINHAQWGTGTNACMFAVNALDGDDTIELKCTEYSITLTKGDGWNQPEPDPETPATKTIVINPNVYGEPATNHGLQYLIEGSSLSELFANGLPKSGETYTIKIVGTADAEFDGMMQFMNEWTGITGEAATAKFTTTEFTIEKDFTFSADLSSTNGKFQLFNNDTEATKKTLTVKTLTFTKKEATPTTEKTIDVTVYHYEGADHGIQYTEAVATCIPAGAKSGDVYTLKMVGTADAEFNANLLFVNGTWAGITGEAIPVTFTTTEFTIEKDFTFSADTDADCKFMLTNAEMSPAVAKKLTLKEYSFTKKVSE